MYFEIEPRTQYKLNLFIGSEIEPINLKYCRSRPIFRKTKTTTTVKNTKQVETIFYAEAF